MPRASKFEVINNTQVIEKAIVAVGSQAELSRQLAEMSGVDCYPQKINEWRVRGVIPPYWVRFVSDIAGIPRGQVDPVLYGD